MILEFGFDHLNRLLALTDSDIVSGTTTTSFTLHVVSSCYEDVRMIIFFHSLGF